MTTELTAVKGVIDLETVPCPLCGAGDHPVWAAGRDFEYATCENEFTLRRCGECDVVYLSPRPAIRELQRIYPPEYNPFNFHRTNNPFLRVGRRFVQWLKVRTMAGLVEPNARIMDVGCGAGTLLILLRRHGRGYELWANDISETAIQHLRDYGVALAVGRFEELDLPGKQFDLLIMNQIIEHLDDVKAVAEKAYELLKPGGFLVIETPCRKGFDYLLFKRRYWGGWHIPRHWILFSQESLKALFLNRGFAFESVRFLPSPSFWIQSFHHLFLEKARGARIHTIFTIRNPFMLGVFTLVDLLMARFNYTSNMRMIFRKAR